MTKKTFLLVHGPWHGAWCWRYVAPLLRQAGHVVHAPDLPGLGQDRTPLSEVTMRLAVERVGDLIDRSAEPVVLVGHSLNGPLIAQVAEEYPIEVAQLVYVTAVIPRDGERLVDVLAAHPQGFAIQAKDVVGEGVRLLPDQAEMLCYHDSPKSDVRQAHKLLHAQAIKPWLASVTLSRRYERVPRAYILCTQDRMISLALQQEMAATCEPVIELPSGHCPFFSMPQQLAECLLALAGTEQTSGLTASAWEC